MKELKKNFYCGDEVDYDDKCLEQCDRDMKCFADFIRNGLLNTEYSCYKLDEHLKQ